MIPVSGDLRPVNVGPRVEFAPGHYPRIRAWDSEQKQDKYLYLHRLTAYAHGIIDDLWAPVDIHHKNADGWCNLPPSNLEALPRWAHQEIEPHVGNLK